MNSVLKPHKSWQPVAFSAMKVTDLDEVFAVEKDAYPFPWTRGNFLDSLDSGYESRVLRDAEGVLLGYFLLMYAVDEVHLLNITVRPDAQRQGLGRKLLDQVILLAQDAGMKAVLLEVRPSNQRALSVYRHLGFLQVGIRKNYYPASGVSREDAIVMRKRLGTEEHES
jgi:ribosomal-protein-alanine N-acetyltransferase